MTTYQMGIIYCVEYRRVDEVEVFLSLNYDVDAVISDELHRSSQFTLMVSFENN